VRAQRRWRALFSPAQEERRACRRRPRVSASYVGGFCSAAAAPNEFSLACRVFRVFYGALSEFAASPRSSLCAPVRCPGHVAVVLPRAAAP